MCPKLIAERRLRRALEVEHSVVLSDYRGRQISEHVKKNNNNINNSNKKTSLSLISSHKTTIITKQRTRRHLYKGLRLSLIHI